MTDTRQNFDSYADATLRQVNQPARLLVGGEWLEAKLGATLPVIDPAFGRHIGEIGSAAEDDVNDAVAAAKRRSDDEAWTRMAPERREALIHRLADVIERNMNIIAELESIDVGMPIGVAQFMVSSCVSSLRYMAGWPSKIEGRTIPVSYPMGGEHFVATVREPVGVVGAIIPWNAPFMIAMWKVAPILATGCTVVLKPSEEASLSVLMLGRLVQEAGIPDGVLNIVTGAGPEAGAALVKHPDVAKVTFTGSTATGRIIARLAADGPKRAALELGGKSPQIVFPSADLDVAVPTIANAIFLNSGQVCAAGSRVYVQRNIYDEVVQRLVEHAGSLSVGHPMDSGTQLGPVISIKQERRIAGYLSQAREQGGTLHTTGRSTNTSEGGYYVLPTVVEAHQDMTITREEVFGPVVAVVPFDEPEEAITLANDTVYGLSAYIYTRDISEALKTSMKIDVGRLNINGAPAPYPSIPEGGRKASGYGRDQGSESLEGYLDTKVITVSMD